MVIIPIHKDSPAVNVNAAGNTGPFCLGVYLPQSGTIFHYSPNGENDNGEDKNIYRHAVRTLRPPTERQFACRRIMNRAIDMYNQSTNQWDNGFFIAMYAELILLRGYDRMFIKQLSNSRTASSILKEQKGRLAVLLSSIIRGEFPIYRPPPTSQKRKPNFLRDIPHAHDDLTRKTIHLRREQ